MANSVAEIFPQLLPLDNSFKRYQGFIEINGNTFELGLDASNPAGISQAQIFLDDRLRAVLSGHEPVVRKRLAQSESIEAFLIELKKLIERLLLSRPVVSTPSADVYLRVISDFEALGWQRVVSVTDDFRAQIQTQDRSGRSHTLELLFPFDYPASEPKISTALPARFQIAHWSPATSSLTTIFQQFCKTVEMYQDFFDLMDDIDARAHVIEPQKPTRADLHRRISLGRHVSIHVSINPLEPRAVPVCRFLGADTAIRPLYTKLNTNLLKWSPTKTISENLETILGVDLAANRLERQQETQEVCQICYDHQMGDFEMPDRICDNPKCGKAYHSVCLQAWLESRPQKRISFDTITGACVNCNEPIFVKLKR